MTHPTRVLYHGDAYRCQRALEDRHAKLATLDPQIERQPRFADETDWGDLDIELRSTSLFARTRHIVIRGVHALSSPKPLLQALSNDLAQSTFVTAVSSSVRASSPLVKGFSAFGKVIALSPPRTREVGGAVREMLAEHGCPTSPELVREMIERNGADLMVHAQEVRKLSSYLRGTVEPSPPIPRSLLYAAGERTIWAMLDHIGGRDLSAALEEWSHLHEDAGRLLSASIRHLTRLTMIRVLLDERVSRPRIMAATATSEWLFRRLEPQASAWNARDIRRVLKHAISLDLSIKEGQRRAEDALLELLLSTIPQPA